MLPRILLVLGVLTASVARADLDLPHDEKWLMVGPLFTSSVREARGEAGIGLEASLNLLDGIQSLGLLGQVEWMESRHSRVCVGVQGTLLFLGLELGVMHETANRLHVATTGLHVAPYLSFIYGSVGLRLGIPLIGAEETRRTRHGFDAAFVLTLKLPVRLEGGKRGPIPHL